jgi:hypothetical protein
LKNLSLYLFYLLLLFLSSITFLLSVTNITFFIVNLLRL